MKATAKEIMDFYHSDWSKLLGGLKDDWYIEDCVWADEAEDLHRLGDPSVMFSMIKLERSGVIAYQGDGEAPGGESEHAPLQVFKKWRKIQTMTVIIVEVPKDKVLMFEDTISQLGFHYTLSE